MTDDIGELLRFDPLAHAEDVTGTSYKEDKGTMALGALFHMGHSERKKKALEAADDTTLSTEWERARRIYTEMGFERVLHENFLGTKWGDEPRAQEHFEVWHRPGVLLVISSYMGRSVNAAEIYYNWRPNPELYAEGGPGIYSFTSSGHYHRDSYDRGERIYIGHHDAREAIRYKLSQLEENGELLTKWVENDMFHMGHHGDHLRSDGTSRPYDERLPHKEQMKRYADLYRERFLKLPEHVREMMGSSEMVRKYV